MYSLNSIEAIQQQIHRLNITDKKCILSREQTNFTQNTIDLVMK